MKQKILASMTACTSLWVGKKKKCVEICSQFKKTFAWTRKKNSFISILERVRADADVSKGEGGGRGKMKWIRGTTKFSSCIGHFKMCTYTYCSSICIFVIWMGWEHGGTGWGLNFLKTKFCQSSQIYLSTEKTEKTIYFLSLETFEWQIDQNNFAKVPNSFLGYM